MSAIVVPEAPAAINTDQGGIHMGIKTKKSQIDFTFMSKSKSIITKM
jgi:hypothetical protein